MSAFWLVFFGVFLIGLTFVIGHYLNKFISSGIVSFGIGFLISFLVIPVVGAYVYKTYTQYKVEMAAARAGFNDAEIYGKAKKLGINSFEEYEIYIANIEEKRKQDLERRKVEKQNQEVLEQMSCLRDLDCLAKQNYSHASVYCVKALEKKAVYGLEWTDGFLDRKFNLFKWGNMQDGTIWYQGDRVRIKNEYGATRNYKYFCLFDTRNKKAINLKTEPGQYSH